MTGEAEQEFPYCPFDIDNDPAAFGLVADIVETRFGKMYVAHSRARTGDTATFFLHGVGSSWTTWSPLLRAAQARGGLPGDLILVDLPGFGRSENRLDHLESLQVAAALTAVIQEFGYDRARLVGHSMGGLLALDMAARPQLEVASLHLASGAAFAIIEAVNRPWASLLHTPTPDVLFWSQYALARTGRGRGLMGFLNRRHLLAPVLRTLVARPRRLRQSVLDALAEEVRPRSYLHAARNIFGYDARARWHALGCGVFAAFGARDQLVPRTDRETLAEVYPAAVATVVPDSSHFLHIERPHETLAALGL